MTTYTKEYSDTSHVWMDSAFNYAGMMHARGLTFEALLTERPSLAKSEWGQDVAVELDVLSSARTDAIKLQAELKTLSRITKWNKEANAACKEALENGDFSAWTRLQDQQRTIDKMYDDAIAYFDKHIA